MITSFLYSLVDDNKNHSSNYSIAVSGNWDDYRASNFAGGSGTNSSPWQINTATQLAYMSYIVRNNVNYADDYYKLTANIDMSAHYFTPIGYTISPLLNLYQFNGNFNGQGYLISGLTINGESFVGLFSNNSGTIKNVNLINVNIKGELAVGGICAVNLGGNIYQCNVSSGTITNSGEYTGGIASASFGTIYSCYNAATINGARFSGGIVGRANANMEIGSVKYNGKLTSGSIHDCYNTGNISGTSSVGGICGNHDDSKYSLSIYNCYNRGSVKGSDVHVGGVFGYNGTSNFNIYDCVNVGSSVTGKNYVGNIIGRNKSNKGYVNNCYYYNSSPKTAGTDGGSSDTVSHISNSGRQSTLLSVSNFYNFITSSSYSSYWKDGSWGTVWWKKDANYNSSYPILYDLYHNLTLNRNGGSGGTSSIYCYRGAKMPNISVPSRTGYSFKGYYANSNGTGIQYYNSNGVSSSYYDYYTSKTIYAYWDANSYTLTANANGGSIPSTSGWSGTGTKSTKSVDYDSSYGALPTPTRTGYTFDGWYDASSGGNKVTSSTKMTTLGETIYAHWTANGYTLTMDANGGSITSSDVWTGSGTKVTKTVKYNDTYDTYVNDKGEVKVGYLPTSSNISRTGYTFDNWWTSGSGGSRVYTTTVMNSTSGATIYAHWTPNIYKITLDKQSGSGGTNEIYLKYNTAWCSNSSGTATITSITKPTRTGYTFGGYYTDKNGAGTQIINASGSITGSKTYIASADTLYAKWTANTYSIVFDKNGGSGSMSNQSMTYDKASNLTTNTYTRQGYYFVGWSKTKLGVQSTIPTSNIYKDEASVNNLATSGSITLYAVWLDTWANHATTPTGSGSSTSPYIIDSAEDLAWMINNHGSALKYFKQTKAINLSKYNWYPIGTSNKPFKGVYDGQGYEITNLNIPEITNASGNKIQSDIGLFGYTSGGEITGIYIKNATIYGKDNVGLIVSNATSTKINSNIIESSTINASGNYGAVAGKISGGEIKYNLVYVTTSGGTSTNGLYTGSTTLSTNLVENNGTRSKVGTEDLTGWGKVFNRLLPSAISWGAKVTPATSSDLTNWVNKTIN